eukprot:3773985-Prymnesium_polylepis.1
MARRPGGTMTMALLSVASTSPREIGSSEPTCGNPKRGHPSEGGLEGGSPPVATPNEATRQREGWRRLGAHRDWDGAFAGGGEEFGGHRCDEVGSLRRLRRGSW